MGSEINDSNEDTGAGFLGSAAKRLLESSFEQWKDYSACEPDYNPPVGGAVTEKRLAYNEAAKHALNQPVKPQTLSPLSESAAQIASQVTKSILHHSKAQIEIDAPIHSPQTDDEQRFLHDIKDIKLKIQDEDSLKDIFSKLNSQGTTQIINAINPQLEKQNLKVVQVETGEIWVGRRESSSDDFELDYMVKGATCKEKPIT